MPSVYAVEVICHQEHIWGRTYLVGGLNRLHSPHPKIEMDVHPHAQLRFVVDARALDQKLSRGEG